MERPASARRAQDEQGQSAFCSDVLLSLMTRSGHGAQHVSIAQSSTGLASLVDPSARLLDRLTAVPPATAKVSLVNNSDRHSRAAAILHHDEARVDITTRAAAPERLVQAPPSKTVSPRRGTRTPLRLLKLYTIGHAGGRPCSVGTKQARHPAPRCSFPCSDLHPLSRGPRPLGGGIYFGHRSARNFGDNKPPSFPPPRKLETESVAGRHSRDGCAFLM